MDVHRGRTAIELKTRTELDVMREAGGVVARALAAVRHRAGVGVATRELDEVAATVLREAHAVPLFPGYHPRRAPGPFRWVIRTSVNDAIAHGAPGPDLLREGDLVSVECGAGVRGWCARAAVTFPVGTAREADSDLVRTVGEALDDGIAAARPGGRVGDISRAIGVVGRSAGYGVPAPIGGHGVGREAREPPFVPNEGRAGQGVPLRPGMVLALRPVFLAGGRDSIRDGDDGWALRTGDGSRAAHAQHTVAITDAGPRVLTLP